MKCVHHWDIPTASRPNPPDIPPNDHVCRKCNAIKAMPADAYEMGWAFEKPKRFRRYPKGETESA